MKSLIIIVSVLAIISCNQEDSTAKSNQTNSSNLKVSGDTGILGSWSMCAYSDNNIMTQMNACAIVGFNNDGSGYVKRNSIISEIFNWKFKDPQLIISSNTGSMFSDTFYYATLTKHKDGSDLTVRHKGLCYYLLK